MADDSMLLELEGFPAFQKLPALWELLRRDGHHFDTFSVGNTDRPLGDDPLAKLKVWTAKKGTRILSLDNSTDPDTHLYLTRFQGMAADLKLRFNWGGRSVDGFLSWLDEVLKLGTVKEGSLRSPAIESSNLYQHGPHASWLFLCGGEERQQLEGAGVPQFLAKEKGVKVHAVKGTLVFQLTASPFEPFKGGIKSLTGEVDGLLLDAVEKKAKVDVLKLTRAAFSKVLGPMGFSEVKGGHRRELLWKREKLVIDAGMSPEGDFSVHARLMVTDTSYYPWRLAEGRVATTAKTLDQALKAFVKDEARFLKNPKRFR